MKGGNKKNIFISKQLIVIGIIFLFFGLNFTPLYPAINTKSPTISYFGKILYVGGSGPNNYTSIQAAIDDTVDGDTVFVFDDSSPYNEHPIVKKSISLIGENKETTVINTGISISLSTPMISGFTIQNAYYGIYIWATYPGSKLCTIKNNIITQNDVGILLSDGDSCILTNNIIIHNGIGISTIYAGGNIITRNLIKENSKEGIFLEDSYGNIISKNNFIENGKHVDFIYDKFTFNNRWWKNYWGKPTYLPRIIRGVVRIYHAHYYDEYIWLNIDWNPAKEPNEIGI